MARKGLEREAETKGVSLEQVCKEHGQSDVIEMKNLEDNLTES